MFGEQRCMWPIMLTESVDRGHIKNVACESARGPFLMLGKSANILLIPSDLRRTSCFAVWKFPGKGFSRDWHPLLQGTGRWPVGRGNRLQSNRHDVPGGNKSACNTVQGYQVGISVLFQKGIGVAWKFRWGRYVTVSATSNSWRIALSFGSSFTVRTLTSLLPCVGKYSGDNV